MGNEWLIHTNVRRMPTLMDGNKLLFISESEYVSAAVTPVVQAKTPAAKKAIPGFILYHKYEQKCDEEMCC